MSQHLPESLEDLVDGLGTVVLTPEDLGLCAEASGILDAARALVARWEAGARTAFRTARAQGLREGRAAAATEIAAAARDYEADLAELRVQVEESLAPVLLAAVRNILGEIGEEEVLRRSLAAAVAARVPAEALTVHLSPGDEGRISLPEGVVVRTEEGLHRGEAVLSGPSGEVRLSIAHHMSALRRALEVGDG